MTRIAEFLDTYSGYNQIKMDPRDQDKTFFITDRGIYCYNVMPFGLKNKGSTYQMFVSQRFIDHMWKSMEVNIFGMLVKLIQADGHLDHL